MGLNLEYLDGQTPLDEDEKEGLLIKAIATRGELDEFEQQNIEQAIAWTLRRSFKAETILTEEFIRDVHKKMYSDVWQWAGDFRTTNKNIGVDKWQIPIELRSLLDDAKYWLDNTTYSADEMAVRFKHRIVSIHCFANGNGRHSRLMADIIIEKIFKQPVFTWGAANLVKQGDTRKAYLTAIRAADAGDIKPLITFARS
ncbi:mobile mystery protein B [Deminuibacter soli]|uniref:Mobile mystery protein B n=1 Tax=Deminuibacter soli TaxID=2291815 RepID=A0A3E1NNT2_9BACT|nr:mobile mystery protein B [Deminuibacter soli]RFM29591.1 mobile mystery protein B [Deminuibacter soli]